MIAHTALIILAVLAAWMVIEMALWFRADRKRTNELDAAELEATEKEDDADWWKHVQ